MDQKDGADLTSKDNPKITLTDEVHDEFDSKEEDDPTSTATDNFPILSTSRITLWSQRASSNNILTRLHSPTPFASKSFDEIVQLYNTLPRLTRKTPQLFAHEWYISLRQIPRDLQGRHCLLIMHTELEDMIHVIGPIESHLDLPVPKDSSLRGTFRRATARKRRAVQSITESERFEDNSSSIFENDMASPRETQHAARVVSRAILQHFLELELASPNLGRPYLYYTDKPPRDERLFEAVKRSGILQPYDMEVAPSSVPGVPGHGMRIVYQNRWNKMKKELAVKKKHGVEMIMIGPPWEKRVKRTLMKVLELGCVALEAQNLVD